MKRATNAAVYAQMEEDINKAIQCFKAIGGEKTIFRPNCRVLIYWHHVCPFSGEI